MELNQAKEYICNSQQFTGSIVAISSYIGNHFEFMELKVYSICKYMNQISDVIITGNKRNCRKSNLLKLAWQIIYVFNSSLLLSLAKIAGNFSTIQHSMQIQDVITN